MESRARSVSHRTQALTRESTSVMTTAFDAWVLSLPPLPPPYPSVRSTAAIMYGYEWSPRRVRDSNRRGTPGPHRRHFASVRIVNGVGPAPRGNRRFSTMGDPRAVEAKLFFFPIPGGCHSHDWHWRRTSAKGGIDARIRDRSVTREKKKKRGKKRETRPRCRCECWVHSWFIARTTAESPWDFQEISLSSRQSGLRSSAMKDLYNCIFY